MVAESFLHQPEGDEVGQQGHGLAAGQMAEAHEAAEGDAVGMRGKGGEELVLLVGEGEDGRGALLLAAPEFHLHGAGDDVLVGNAHEGAVASVFHLGAHGSHGGGLYGGDDDGAPLRTEALYVARHGWVAPQFAGSLHHIHLLFAPHAGYAAVVLDADEQASAVGVGKGGEAVSNLADVGNLVLEVLLLMLALCDEVSELHSAARARCRVR